jgi:alpha-L-fucosidase 2
MRFSWLFGCCFAIGSLLFICWGSVYAQSTSDSAVTAWRSGRFEVDVAGVLSRSDIVLGHPMRRHGRQCLSGNGNLGVAVWSADGFTAQLNRADTLPERRSPGQAILPGLSVLTDAKDYAGRLNLYEGEFQEHGGGMTATAYVQPDTSLRILRPG